MTYLKATQTGTHLASNGWTLTEVKTFLSENNFKTVTVRHVLTAYFKQINL
jgi:hypothetical protein